MSDFTVFDVAFPAEARQRVIVNTDAKNEADDQYAIVHAVLTPSFELHGIIPAHYGTRKTPTSLRESHDETVKLSVPHGPRRTGADRRRRSSCNTG